MYLPLQIEETILKGDWIVRDEKVVGNEVCERIRWLIHSQLQMLGNDKSGWETLFRDPRDGRLWELSYPLSEMHGGGPPQLTIISPDKASQKYVL